MTGKVITGVRTIPKEWFDKGEKVIEVKLEQGVEIPPIRYAKQPLYPYAQMQVGDSFALPADADGKVERSLRASSYRHGRLKGGKFVVRVVEDKVRVWKVE